MMLRRVLLDTGPLVAWMDRDDAHHAAVQRWMAAYRGELITTWPVRTATSHLVPDRAAPLLLQWIERGGATLAEIPVASRRCRPLES